MTFNFTKRHLFISILTVFLLVGFVVGAYFLFVQPEKDNLERKEANLKTVNQELVIAENKQQQLKDQIIKSSMELQKQLPVKPLLEQLLLDIEKAEMVSNTEISQISVDDIDQEVAISDEEESVEESNEADKDEDTEADDSQIEADTETEAGDEATSEKEKAFLPTGMKVITVNVTATAENYFEMERFIDVLQSLQRIVEIDSLRFTGQEEITTMEESYTPISFNVNIIAFYYPKLENLQKELPKIDVPESANKKNPFISFSIEPKETLDKLP